MSRGATHSSLGPPSLSGYRRGDALDCLTAEERNALILSARPKLFADDAAWLRRVARALGLGRPGWGGADWEVPDDVEGRVKGELARIKLKVEREAERLAALEPPRENGHRTWRPMIREEPEMAEDEKGTEKGTEERPRMAHAREALELALAEAEERLLPLLTERDRLKAALAVLDGAAPEAGYRAGPKPEPEPEPDLPPAAEEPEEEEPEPPEEEQVKEKETPPPPETAPLREKIAEFAAAHGEPFAAKHVRQLLDLGDGARGRDRASYLLRHMVKDGVLVKEGKGAGTRYRPATVPDALGAAEPPAPPAETPPDLPTLEEVRDYILRNHKDGEPFYLTEVMAGLGVPDEAEAARHRFRVRLWRPLAERGVIAKEGSGPGTRYRYVRPTPEGPYSRPRGSNGGPSDGVTGVDAPPDRGRTVPGTGRGIISRVPR